MRLHAHISRHPKSKILINVLRFKRIEYFTETTHDTTEPHVSFGKLLIPTLEQAIYFIDERYPGPPLFPDVDPLQRARCRLLMLKAFESPVTLDAFDIQYETRPFILGELPCILDVIMSAERPNHPVTQRIGCFS